MDDPDRFTYPGEEHYYKLQERPPYYRRHFWMILTFVLLVAVILLLVTTVVLLNQHQQGGPISQSTPKAMTQVATSVQLTPTPQVKVFAAGHTWQGEYNQNDSAYTGTSQSVFKVDSIQGTTFLGSYSILSNNSIAAISGEIINNINDVSDTTDKGRLQEVINRYGSKGFLIKYTDTTLLQGNGIQLNVDDYALVGNDGTIKGIWYYFPSVSVPDGDFFYQ